MREIRLKGKYGEGKVLIIDDDDYEWVSKWSWNCNRYGYVYHNSIAGRNKPGLLHRLIMRTSQDETCDHINGNTLDNRKSNLRNCTNAQNCWNGRMRSVNTSGYRGVCWDKSRSKWIVTIRDGSRKINVGRFNDRLEAARAWNDAAREIHGEYARLNIV